MKFACEQCRTKYSIADERVRGKVLKIRCKSCGHVMTVRDDDKARGGKEKGVLERAMEQALEAPPTAALQPSDATIVGSPDAVLGTLMNPPALDPEEWHVSVDGNAQGPLRLEALAQKIIVERAAGDGELFVWRDGFDDWLAPREVPEVRVAVERLRPGLPSSFWGTPEPLFPSAPRGEVRSTHPVDRIESFEFTDTPPTISVPRKTTAALARELQQREGALEPARRPAGPPQTRPSAPPLLVTPPTPARPAPPTAPTVLGEVPEPRRAAAPPRLPGAPPPPSPFEAAAPLPPAPSQPRSIESIHEALAHLDDDDVLPEDAAAPSGISVQLNISEPSQMIDLRELAGAMPTGRTPEPVLPGIDLPPAPVAPPVMVMTGPAPAAPGRHMKAVLGAAIGVCLLLTGVVAYLLTHRTAGERAQTEKERPGEGKAVTDRPVLVKDEAQPAQAEAPGAPDSAAKKNGAAAKKPVKLPAAAAGKTQLNGNAEALAKLYGTEPGAEKAPTLPQSNSGGGGGGGVSTAELQDVMRKNQKSLSMCYERVLKHDESLRRARIDVQVRVGQTGTVTHVTIAAPYGGTELGTCMQQTIRRWHFPPSDSDYETQFPLILTAN